MESQIELGSGGPFMSTASERPQSRIMQVLAVAAAGQHTAPGMSLGAKPLSSSNDPTLTISRGAMGNDSIMAGAGEAAGPYAYAGYSANAPAFVPSGSYFGAQSQPDEFLPNQSQPSAYLGSQNQQYLESGPFAGSNYAQFDAAQPFDAPDSDSVHAAYCSTPSFIASRNVATKQQRLATSYYFGSEELRTELLNRSVAQTSGSASAFGRVEHYRDLVPLEVYSGRKSAVFGGLSTTVYRCVSMTDGLTYVLRRVHNFRAANSRVLPFLEAWRTLEHANLVALRDVFTTSAFNDTSLCFVYDFFPGAETLYKLHFAPMAGNAPNQTHSTANGDSRPFSAARQASGSQSASALRAKQAASASLSENVLWNYVLQLSSVIRAVHQLNLACRVLDASKILVTSRSRLRLNAVGILDVVSLANTPAANIDGLIKQYQQEDLLTFGHLLLALACNSAPPQRDPSRLEMQLRNYSQDFRNVVFYLTGGPPKRGGATKSIHDIMPLIGARFYTHLEASMLRGDILENELAKELENGRLYRLVCKLNSILERAEFAADPSWSETGDRYMLKLFRDFVFHQVDEHGQPFLDLVHMTQTLNKLDMRSNERVCLVSRDQQSVVVLTYSEVRACLDTAFEELSAAAQAQPLLPVGSSSAANDAEQADDPAAYSGLVHNFAGLAMVSDPGYYHQYAYDPSQAVSSQSSALPSSADPSLMP